MQMVNDTEEQKYVTDLCIVWTDLEEGGKGFNVREIHAVHGGAIVEETMGLDEGNDVLCHSVLFLGGEG